jgi:hypothetical protein
MTDEQKIIGLIPAKSLGCLSSEDESFFHSYIDQESSFPWDEFGKYQFIASLLPLALQLEIPEPQLKDTVALKLIKLSEEQRAKKIHEEAETLATNITEEQLDHLNDDTVVSDNLIDDQLVAEDNETSTSFNLDDVELPEIDTPEPFSIPVPQNEEQDLNNFPSEDQSEQLSNEESDIVEEQMAGNKLPDSEILEETTTVDFGEDDLQLNQPEEEIVVGEQVDEYAETVTPSTLQVEDKRPVEEVSESIENIETPKKTLNEKIYRAIEEDFESLKSSVNETDRRLTKNLLMAYVAIAVLLALLIFSFFKFSSDIKSLENEIKDIKKNPTSELIDRYNFSSQFFFHS